MGGLVIVCADPGLAVKHRPEVEAAGGRLELLTRPARTAAPNPGAWERAVSELALAPWLLLVSSAAAEATLEALGAPPGATTRVAAVAGAERPFLEHGRTADLTAPGLRALVERLRPVVGRRQRILVPHAAGAGRRVAGWLAEAGADPVAVAAYDLPGSPPSLVSEGAPTLALASTPEGAEVLRWALAAGRPEALAGTLVAARGEAAFDAAEDCGFVHVTALGDHLGPLLDEALS